MEDLAKIKNRIAKLLSMANDTSSPEEAAIAAERARKLMDKYQVDSWDIQEVRATQFTSKQVDWNKSQNNKYMFLWGVSSADYARIQAALVGRADTKTGTSLVIVKKHLVESHFGGANYVAKKFRSRDEDDTDAAYARGMIAGQNQEINKSVEN